MGHYDRPLPKQVTDAMFDRWESVIKRHECACILDAPCSNRQYRIQQFISEPVRQDPHIHYVPVVIQSFQSEKWQEIESQLDEYRKGKFTQTVFFVIDGEWMIRSMPFVFGNIQQYLLRVRRSVSFFWFIESDILSPLYTSIVTNCPSFIQNILYDRQHEPTSVYHFIRHMEGVHGFALGDKDRNEIVQHCGGHLWIAAEAIRHAHECGKVTYDHDAMTYRIRRVWEGFSQHEQQVLKYIAQKKLIPSTLARSLEFLIRLRLVVRGESSYSVSIPLLEKYIYKVVDEQQHLVIGADDKLYVHDVCVDPQFTQRENDLIKALLRLPGQLVLRDKLAYALWGDGWEDHSSDWALDQALRRIREKLRVLGMMKPFFQTVKGKGVYVSP